MWHNLFQCLCCICASAPNLFCYRQFLAYLREAGGVGMWLGIGMQALNVALDFILIAVLGQGV